MDFPKKGQRIYCKNCDTTLFEVKEDIQAGDVVLGPSTLEPIGEMKSKIKLYHQVNCWKCNTMLNIRDMIIR